MAAVKRTDPMKVRIAKVLLMPSSNVAPVSITWAFFQHLLSGIRHLVMDTGATFELGINKTFAILTFIGSVLLTAAMWAYLLGVVK